MKYLLLVLVLIFITSCSSKSHLTLMSDQQIDINDFSVNTNNKGNYVKGTDKVHIVILFPTGSNPTFSDAYNEALDGGSADKLVDVELSSWSFYIPYIYGQFGLEVSGYEGK